MAFLRIVTLSTNAPFDCFSASPALASRLQTTGQRLQRGRLLQQRFFGLMIRLANSRGIASPPMAADAFVTLLNEQIAHEYAAHQQYVACAVYYDAETLPQLARFFYAQALEERDHAMMMVQYLLDADAEVVIPGIAAPQVAFSDVVEIGRASCRERGEGEG